MTLSTPSPKLVSPNAASVTSRERTLIGADARLTPPPPAEAPSSLMDQELAEIIFRASAIGVAARRLTTALGIPPAAGAPDEDADARP
ncbi:MAG TPA: hypothetical protein VGV90_07460 [Solirubrobacteraceae bacterium]|nr:hypothetical protein [Solirubrobacteraceae bacterium]